MKVFVCYEVFSSSIDENSYVVKVVDSEDKALEFINEVEPGETYFRTYDEVEVE